MKYDVCWETELSAGSAKGSYSAVKILSRKKCLIRFKLAPTFLRKDIRVEKQGSFFLSSLESRLESAL